MQTQEQHLPTKTHTRAPLNGEYYTPTGEQVQPPNTPRESTGGIPATQTSTKTPALRLVAIHNPHFHLGAIHKNKSAGELQIGTRQWQREGHSVPNR